MFCCDRCSLVQLSLWEYLGKKEKGERHITTLKMAIIMTFTCCVSHHVLQSPFSSSPPLLSLPVYPTPATFQCLDSHWMENIWVGDCPEHIMPNSSMNSHLPLPSPPLSSMFPCSLSSFKVGPCSWNKRKTACMRTCFSSTYGTLSLSSFLWIRFPTLLPGGTLVLWLVLLLTRWQKQRYNAAELYGEVCIQLNNVSYYFALIPSLVHLLW